MIKDYESIGVAPGNDDKYYVIKNGEWVEYKIADKSILNLLTLETIPPGGNAGDTLIANSAAPGDYGWAPIPTITNPLEIVDDLDSEIVEEDKNRAISARAITYMRDLIHEVEDEFNELSELDNTIAQLKEANNNN